MVQKIRDAYYISSKKKGNTLFSRSIMTILRYTNKNVKQKLSSKDQEKLIEFLKYWVVDLQYKRIVINVIQPETKKSFKNKDKSINIINN